MFPGELYGKHNLTGTNLGKVLSCKCRSGAKESAFQDGGGKEVY